MVPKSGGLWRSRADGGFRGTLPAMYRSLIRDQHGVISRAQLLECGRTRHQIAHALTTGELTNLVGSVYRASTHTMTPEALVHGTLLWLGDDGVLIGRAAAWWWGLIAQPPNTLDFSGPRRKLAAPLGTRTHQVYVDTVDRTSYRGIAVLTKPMAALRAAADLEKKRRGAGLTLIDRAIQNGLDHREFIGILKRHRWCTGNALGRYLTDICSDDSESIGERRTAALMSQGGISGWCANYWVPAGEKNYRVDFGFKKQRLAVEFDGFAFHSSPDQFANDRLRYDDLHAAGWSIVHVTWRELHANPHDVVRRIKRALARRPDFGTRSR